MRKLLLDYILIDDRATSPERVSINQLELRPRFWAKEFKENRNVLTCRGGSMELRRIVRAFSRLGVRWRPVNGKQLVLFATIRTVTDGDGQPIVNIPVVRLSKALRAGDLLLHKEIRHLFRGSHGGS